MIGFVAAFLIAVAYLPQCWMVYRSKKCEMSSLTLFIIITAMILWTVHATIRLDLALMCSSLFSLAQMLFMVRYKF